MTQPSLVTQSQLLLNQARTAGQTPVFFGMNQATMRTVAAELHQAAQGKLSLLGRWMSRLRDQDALKRLQSLQGLPVIDNPHLPDGSLVLMLAQIPVQASPQAGQQNALAREPMAEFQQKVAAEPGDGAPTLAEMAKGDGLTPSAILMTAFRDIERVKQVVVIRVYENEDVDLCLNANTFEAAGILQKAQYWLATRG